MVFSFQSQYLRGGGVCFFDCFNIDIWKMTTSYSFDWKVRMTALAPLSYDDDSSLSTTSMVTGRPWLLLLSRTLHINLEHLGQGQKRGAEGAGTPFINIAITPWTYPKGFNERRRQGAHQDTPHPLPLYPFPYSYGVCINREELWKWWSGMSLERIYHYRGQGAQ